MGRVAMSAPRTTVAAELSPERPYELVSDALGECASAPRRSHRPADRCGTTLDSYCSLPAEATTGPTCTSGVGPGRAPRAQGGSTSPKGAEARTGSRSARPCDRPPRRALRAQWAATAGGAEVSSAAAGSRGTDRGGSAPRAADHARPQVDDESVLAEPPARRGRRLGLTRGSTSAYSRTSPESWKSTATRR